LILTLPKCDFDVRDKERLGPPKKFEDVDLQKLLDEKSSQMVLELSIALNVIRMAVSKCLHALGKIHKDSYHMNCQKMPF